MSLIGSIAKSTAGRDRGRIFIIVGVLDDSHVLVADGRLRKIEKPKKKKLKHLGTDGKPDREAVMLIKENRLTNKTAAKITASYHNSPTNVLQTKKE